MAVHKRKSIADVEDLEDLVMRVRVHHREILTFDDLLAESGMSVARAAELATDYPSVDFTIRLFLSQNQRRAQARKRWPCDG